MSEKTYTHPRLEQHRTHAEVHNHEIDKLDELIARGRHPQHEQSPDHEQTPNPETSAEKPAQAEQTPKQTQEKLHALRHETLAQSVPAEQLLTQHHAEAEPVEDAGIVGRDLREVKYSRTLQSVSKNLNPPERALSKVIHNPIVDSVSNAAEKTIARPSGLLAGSICAFIGSSVFLYIARHYGYEYNFLIFALFFIAGFILGLAIELVYRLFKKAPKH